MSDRIRTALENGGTINISIDINAYGLVKLCVVESWARLTGIQRSEIQARTLDAADDPDKFIADEVKHLFDKHMNWKVSESTYPDRAGEVRPLECHTNASSYSESGCDEWGREQRIFCTSLLI